MSVTAAATATETAPTRATGLPPQPPRRGPGIRIRRYGRSDFERFDQETARGSHLCIGSTNIGKVDIDCRYHWKKTQWGVLGNEERPAGIVYMDITFKQPKGYWLDRASVFITLSEDMSSYAIAAPPDSTAVEKPPPGSDYAVQITDHFGPRSLTGVPTLLAETKHDKFAPSVGAMGFEVGGVGREFTTSKHRVGRWVFKGTVRRPKGRDGLRTLEWEISENDINPEQVHSQAYHTAFAFEHSERPVFMRVEIQGKLRDRKRQWKHEMLRFSSSFGKKDLSTLTELDLGRHIEFTRPLDKIAEGLDFAMEMANRRNIPVEVSNPAYAQFFFEPSPGSPTTSPGLTQRPPLRPPLASQQGYIQESEEVLELQRHECRYVQDCVTNPVVEPLHQQPRDEVGSDVAACIQMDEARRDSEMTNEDTLVASSESVSVKTITPSPEAIDQQVLDIVKIPALLTILRLIATMLQWFSRTQQLLPEPTGKTAPVWDGQELIGDGSPFGAVAQRYQRALERSDSGKEFEEERGEVGPRSPLQDKREERRRAELAEPTLSPSAMTLEDLRAALRTPHEIATSSWTL